jgi:hypothetical protein
VFKRIGTDLDSLRNLKIDLQISQLSKPVEMNLSSLETEITLKLQQADLRTKIEEQKLLQNFNDHYTLDNRSERMWYLSNQYLSEEEKLINKYSHYFESYSRLTQAQNDKFRRQLTNASEFLSEIDQVKSTCLSKIVALEGKITNVKIMVKDKKDQLLKLQGDRK